MNMHTKSREIYTEMGGGMNSEEGESLKDLVKLYYGETNLSDEEEAEVDELLNRIEESGFLDKCREVERQAQKERERKCVRIGRWWISKVAVLIIAVSLISVMGVTVYAAVTGHIRSIEVENADDHGIVKVEYSDTTEHVLSEIEEYIGPGWIPDGFSVESENKNILDYSINLVNADGQFISYSQTLPVVKTHYSTENGVTSKVTYGQYKGEFIKTEKANLLIVTDGLYIYSIISEHADKDTLLRMLN